MPNAIPSVPVRLALQVCLLALTVGGCANRGMEAPGPEETGTGGSFGAGGSGTGGVSATGGTGGSGAGGRGGTGGTVGTGGRSGTGGVTGTGGITATGGVTGTGGTAGGGGSAGAAGTTGGAGGNGGAKGTGGAAGAGGKAGASGNVCSLGGVLVCSSAGALKLPDGHVADFSSAEWNGATSAWCNADGLSGTVFAYSGPTPSAATAAVDTTAQNLKLSLTVGATGYAGGGLTFDSCVNASSFTSLQFTAALTAGSLSGCTWQVQLQTQDQRDSTATKPSGGTCNATTTTCFRFPAVTGLTAPTATASTYRETFTSFSNPASSTIATPTQVTGIQWQVNSGSSGAGTCTVELRLDNIIFR